jgi:cation transport protein ChaC
MLALEPGGRTEGIALRLHDRVVAEELRVLWTREMATGSYRPRWTTVTLRGGQLATAIAFVADPARPEYEADASVETIAPLIAAAHGSFGSNAEYVHMLDFALADAALEDEYVCHIVGKLKCIAEQRGHVSP